MAYADYGTPVKEFQAANPRPGVQVQYFARKGDEVREFAQHGEAVKFGVITDRVVDRSALDQWELTFNTLKSEQLDAWKASIRIKYPMINTQQFERAFSIANGESDTYAELEEMLDSWYNAFFG